MTQPLGLPSYEAPKKRTEITIVLGVLVGEDETPTTITAVRYDVHLVRAADPLSDSPPIWITHYAVLNREQLPLDTSYPAIALRVNTLARRLHDRAQHGDYHVLVDASDVGRPVVDFIRGLILPAVHVTSVRVRGDDTADASILWRNDATVGLGYLISRLRAILQGGRLHVPPQLASIPQSLAAYAADNGDPPPDLRALALACASEFQSIRYDVSPDELPSAAL